MSILLEAFDEMVAETVTTNYSDYGVNHPTYDDRGMDGDRRRLKTTIKVSEYNYIHVHLDAVGMDGGGQSHELYFSHTRTPYEDISFNRSNSGQAIKVISAVMYVGKEMIKRAGINSVYFGGYDPRLESIYRRMIDNGRFNVIMSEIGFSYVGEQYEHDAVVFMFKKGKAGY